MDGKKVKARELMMTSQLTKKNGHGTSLMPNVVQTKRISSTIKSILEPRYVVSSTMPYADKKYSMNVYNPPANEINFMGGLGTKVGNVRSKVHTNRPTANQQLLKMRTSNRILVTFCEDPGEL